MPEISRFLGVVIRMYVEAGGPHQRPHFHAYYQDRVGIFGVAPVEKMAGSLPPRQERLTIAWAEIHERELLECWEALQSGYPASKIEPLR